MKVCENSPVSPHGGRCKSQLTVIHLGTKLVDDDKISFISIVIMLQKDVWYRADVSKLK